MTELTQVSDKIKSLKIAHNILKKEYSESEFHKKKEAYPQDTMPPSPDDEKIYKLLTAIQQLDFYIKKYQEEQLELLKEQEES